MIIPSLSCSSSVLIRDLSGDRYLSLCVCMFEVSLLSLKSWEKDSFRSEASCTFKRQIDIPLCCVIIVSKMKFV